MQQTCKRLDEERKCDEPIYETNAQRKRTLNIPIEKPLRYVRKERNQRRKKEKKKKERERESNRGGLSEPLGIHKRLRGKNKQIGSLASL